MQDLSTIHQPVSDFLKLADLSQPDNFELSKTQLDFYREKGYIAGLKLLDTAQVEFLRNELASLVNESHPGRPLFYEYNTNESDDPDKILFHALGAWRVAPGFHDLLWNPRFLLPASQLLSGGVRFWHDQIFYKPDHHGGVVAWHQDYSYWTRTQPLAHLSCWIGLDDSTVENGCVHYVPGSHRWELLPITGLANSMDAIRTVLSAEQQNQFRPVAIELKAGEASFHHPLMIHGSFENRTSGPRRAAVINVFRDGVMSASDDPLLEGVPPVPLGEKMGGQFFPLLYEPKA